ncbi:MAG: MlaD family protein [Planctomycetaceae bacterium]|jgi:phospholipid/cholesterol/gamma-HCH transport system substrate-binding protein|nr:MlaD family protein [Planctomycetaceae bacterium]
MTERQLQFRVGIFVIIAAVSAAMMIFQFGEFGAFWQRPITVVVHFSSAPGVQPGGPVEMNGIPIGTVRDIGIDRRRGGARVRVDLLPRFQVRSDARPRLIRSLFGDTTIEFTLGRQGRTLRDGDVLEGLPPVDPMNVVARLDEQLRTTMASFERTSVQWGRVAENINGLVDNRRGDLERAIGESAVALAQFSKTMTSANALFANANQVLGDPRQQHNLRQSLDALPRLVGETEATIKAVRRTVLTVNTNLVQLQGVTAPLARRGDSIVARIDATLGNLESLTADLGRFSRVINTPSGSLSRLARDPALYRNLNESSGSLALLLKNLQPVIRDLRIFSDKVARHPELLGVQGALRGSAGVKEPPREANSGRGARRNN